MKGVTECIDCHINFLGANNEAIPSGDIMTMPESLSQRKHISTNMEICVYGELTDIPQGNFFALTMP